MEDETYSPPSFLETLFNASINRVAPGFSDMRKNDLAAGIAGQVNRGELSMPDALAQMAQITGDPNVLIRANEMRSNKSLWEGPKAPSDGYVNLSPEEQVASDVTGSPVTPLTKIFADLGVPAPQDASPLAKIGGYAQSAAPDASPLQQYADNQSPQPAAPKTEPPLNVADIQQKIIAAKVNGATDDQIKQWLAVQQLPQTAAADAVKLKNETRLANQGQSSLGKLSADYQAGLLTKEEYASAKQNLGMFPEEGVGAKEGVHGEAFLGGLPQSTATTVKALAEGKMQFPAGFALKSPYWQQMISAVAQYDPSFDAVNYNARNATRKDFTSGKSADNITALNTAISHLGSLSDAYDKLDNTRFGWENAVENAIRVAGGGTETQSNVSEVETKAEAVAHELAKVFRSSGMSEAEIKAWKDKITTSATPAESTSLIRSAVDLMNGRLEALGARYNQGMGTAKTGIDLLSPEAKKNYAKIAGKIGYDAPSVDDPAIPPPAQPTQTPAPITAINPKTGEELVLKNGAWSKK